MTKNEKQKPPKLYPRHTHEKLMTSVIYEWQRPLLHHRCRLSTNGKYSEIPTHPGNAVYLARNEHVFNGSKTNIHVLEIVLHEASNLNTDCRRQ